MATTVPPYEEAVNSCARMVIAESVRWIEVVLVNHDLEFVEPLGARIWSRKWAWIQRQTIAFLTTDFLAHNLRVIESILPGWNPVQIDYLPAIPDIPSNTHQQPPISTIPAQVLDPPPPTLYPYTTPQPVGGTRKRRS